VLTAVEVVIGFALIVALVGDAETGFVENADCGIVIDHISSFVNITKIVKKPYVLRELAQLGLPRLLPSVWPGGCRVLVGSAT
jgi:hypothetical protein